MSNPVSFPQRIQELGRKYVGAIDLFLSIFFLGSSLFVLLYYITGPSLGFFHSDCTDSLLWSRMMLEEGKVFASDFAYAALLPFGSPFFMVPILAIFGYTMTAQVVSMSVFALLFVGASLFFFRSLRWRYSVSSFATFCLCMLLSGSVKIREIMWEHVIYYSLGILFLLLLLGISLRLLDAVSEEKKTHRPLIWEILLFLFSVGIATDGMQMLAISLLPVVVALLAVAFFDEETPLISKKAVSVYRPVALMLLGALAGTLLLRLLTKNGEISASYGNAYSTWSPMGQWWQNAEQFFSQYLSLFGIAPKSSDPLFSLVSVGYLIRFGIALLLLILPLVLLLRLKRLSCPSTVVLFAHLTLSAVILLGFVCGKLSSASWRLIPMIGSAILASSLCLWELFFDGKRVARRISCFLVIFFLAASLLPAEEILSMPYSYGEDQPMLQVVNTLSEKGYTRGYATFWQSQKATLLSGGEVEVITISADDGKLRRRAYQNRSSWYEDIEGQETYFLLLTQTEASLVKNSPSFGVLTEKNPILDEFTLEGYIVMVLGENPFGE